MKTKLLLRISSSLLLVFLFSTSCEKEAFVQEEMPIDSPGSIFPIEEFKKSFALQNIEINWNTYMSMENEIGETREYPVYVANSPMFTQDGSEMATKYSLLATNNTARELKKWRFLLLKYMATDATSISEVSFFEKKDFSGPIYFYDIQGRTVKIEGYTQGQLISVFEDKEKGEITPTSKEPEIGCSSSQRECGEEGNPGEWRTVLIKQYTDWYNVRSNGNLDYSYSVSNGYRYDRVWVPSGHSGGGEYQTGGGEYHSHVSGGPGPSKPNYDHREEIIWNPGKILEVLAPETPIKNLKEFLDCYDTKKSAVITIYVNQPSSGTSASYDPTSVDPVGHAFISISQNGNTSTFGFYPEKEGKKDAISGPSIIGDNGGDDYDVSMSISVSGSTLKKIIDKALSFPSRYAIYSYNCTDYALGLANLAGANIANAWGPYPGGGGGDNPGKLGQILRSRNNGSGITINKKAARAPAKGSGCN